MKSTSWKKKIIENCKSAGTYSKHYEEVITTLSEILEKRDDAEALYQQGGGLPIIEVMGSQGQIKQVKNPALQIWQDLNTQALAYWRDLGLTPAGLKKINEQAVKSPKGSLLAAALKDMIEND